MTICIDPTGAMPRHHGPGSVRILITPNVRPLDGLVALVGGWRLAHEATGLSVTDRVFRRLADARTFALLLAASGVAFTSPAVAGNELARLTVRACPAETAGALG